MSQTTITVARGDGIGPEIMDATLRILEAAGAPLSYDFIEVGERCFLEGETSGIAPASWDVIRRNKVLLKAPITTPLGGGYKSLNVTLRKTLNLYANIRPTKSYAPFVASSHPGMNLVIIRENEEDLYAGIEHQQTPEVTQVLKLITRPGTERIVRYAFEYARAYGRRKVTCMTKDNIMKLTDGLFHRTFEQVAAEYSDIESEHQIIDIGAARLAAQPERFDVIVSLNLYGDILSDIASQIAGSVGLAGSANIGGEAAMFEAVHGSAPDIAGKGVANPSGLLLAATQMLVHLGEADIAKEITHAWLCTLEDGIHPADVYREGLSKSQVGTEAYTRAIIERLGRKPTQLSGVQYRSGGIKVAVPQASRANKTLVGIDVFLDWNSDDRKPDALGALLERAAPSSFRLKMVTNRGVKVYPGGMPETFCTDHWRCRFLSTLPAEKKQAADPGLGFEEILRLLGALHEAGLEVIKTEHLYEFDGVRGYSL
ncbi:MAG: NADP-dependent isocitrate dehydrogenase, partial [Myxococcota bacterium]